MLKLNIRAFFFNAQTDYLPYYKNFAFKVKKSTTLLDILKLIKNQNSDFSYPNKNIILRVNGLVLTADETMATIVEKLGTELQIDPALTYRSNNGLILNDDDFMQSFELLSNYTNDVDKAYYQSLYPLHYASASFEYNHKYIGDAILLLASKLLEQQPKNEEGILKAINDEFGGISYCEYENNLFHEQDHRATINTLKVKAPSQTKASLIEKLCSLAIKEKVYSLESDTLSERKIALYMGDRDSTEIIDITKEQVTQCGATFVHFPSSVRVSGQTLVKSNPQLAYKKAGKMLLDALDHGADTLLIAKAEDLKIFTRIIGHCEKVVGRPIPLNLIALCDFQKFVVQVEA
jgi:succinate dehydrogenase/fumarate reductase-like Fe-S protein